MLCLVNSAHMSSSFWRPDPSGAQRRRLCKHEHHTDKPLKHTQMLLDENSLTPWVRSQATAAFLEDPRYGNDRSLPCPNDLDNAGQSSEGNKNSKCLDGKNRQIGRQLGVLHVHRGPSSRQSGWMKPDLNNHAIRFVPAMRPMPGPNGRCGSPTPGPSLPGRYLIATRRGKLGPAVSGKYGSQVCCRNLRSDFQKEFPRSGLLGFRLRSSHSSVHGWPGVHSPRPILSAQLESGNATR